MIDLDSFFFDATERNVASCIFFALSLFLEGTRFDDWSNWNKSGHVVFLSAVTLFVLF